MSPKVLFSNWQSVLIFTVVRLFWQVINDKNILYKLLNYLFKLKRFTNTPIGLNQAISSISKRHTSLLLFCFVLQWTWYWGRNKFAYWSVYHLLSYSTIVWQTNFRFSYRTFSRNILSFVTMVWNITVITANWIIKIQSPEIWRFGIDYSQY